MQYAHWLLVLVILGVGSFLTYKWKTLSSSSRRVLLGVLMLLSIFYFVPVTAQNFDRMGSVQFCLQCHAMESYGKGLKVDTDEAIATIHYQNNYVPYDRACYTCHTDYGMFGTIQAKIGGLKHLLVHYTGTTPEKIQLYKPYDPKNCLHCHQGRAFKDVTQHNKEDALPKILKGEMSCSTTGCHDIIHVKDFDDVQFVNEKELPGGGHL